MPCRAIRMRSSVRWPAASKARFVLASLLLGSAVLGLVFGFTAFGRQINEYAYDFLFRLDRPAPWKPDSIILAIDERTLLKYGGLRGMRLALTEGLNLIAPAHPGAVAIDLILAEAADEDSDSKLEAAFALTPKLILPADLLPDRSGWEEPIPRFAKHAVEVGHVHADLDKYDSVSRALPLMKAVGRVRHWALAFETFHVVHGGEIEESETDVRVGNAIIPADIRDCFETVGCDGESWRTIRIRYAPPSMGGIPRVGIADLAANPGLAKRFGGKVVFAGVTAQTAVRDRWMTPYSDGESLPGIEIHANAYETLARGSFLVDVHLRTTVLMTLLLAFATGFAYAWTRVILANSIAFAGLIASQLVPAVAFHNNYVWPYLPGTLAVVFAAASAASWRHILDRRRLFDTEQERGRYQKAMQFVTHEMRTPLTAIQGSSELISRYGTMPESKRKEMADLINMESKRLARMIETFLSVERLSAGQMEIKHQRFTLVEIVDRCLQRAQPLADRKDIAVEVHDIPNAPLVGDLELMEYAVYNLLTNAIKYSPRETRVVISGENGKGDRLALSVQDQGIGMDKKEVSRIFEKFYRTKKAEQSGEMGTGIGLSIVDQIVKQHGGSIHVESEPGKGSKFTLILKRAA